MTNNWNMKFIMVKTIKVLVRNVWLGNDYIVLKTLISIHILGRHLVPNVYCLAKIKSNYQVKTNYFNRLLYGSLYFGLRWDYWNPFNLHWILIPSCLASGVIFMTWAFMLFPNVPNTISIECRRLKVMDRHREKVDPKSVMYCGSPQFAETNYCQSQDTTFVWRLSQSDLTCNCTINHRDPRKTLVATLYHI